MRSKMHQFAKNFNRRKPSMDHWMNFSVGSLDDDLVFKIIEILREESNISQTAKRERLETTRRLI